MLKITARQRILAYLKKQHRASAGQVGTALSMSAANVRHHLAILLADGRIAQVGEFRRGRRGRPVKAYSLSEKFLGDNLPLLSDAILEEWLDALPPEKKRIALEAVAKRILNYRFSPDHDKLMARRLASVVDGLNMMNYQSRWEAGAEGPRILLGRCPYATIIDKHPELCQMDAALLSECLGGPVLQKSKIGREGASVCIFALSQV